MHGTPHDYKNIAELAGMSPSSVSIVINKGKGVSEKTRQALSGTYVSGACRVF